MQTNAPAGSEFVDQYNRAVAFGQIGGANGAPLPDHASTHATGGSDPVTPASIGAVSLVTNNTVTVPKSAIFRIDGVNLLATPVGSRTVFYTVPAGLKFSVSSFKFIITNTNQSVAFTTAPTFGITNTGLVKVVNDLVLSNQRVIVNGDVFNSSGSFGSGSTQRVISTDTLGLSVVSPVLAGGTQSIMEATVFVFGELYS